MLGRTCWFWRRVCDIACVPLRHPGRCSGSARFRNMEWARAGDGHQQEGAQNAHGASFKIHPALPMAHHGERFTWRGYPPAIAAALETYIVFGAADGVLLSSFVVRPRVFGQSGSEVIFSEVRWLSAQGLTQQPRRALRVVVSVTLKSHKHPDTGGCCPRGLRMSDSMRSIPALFPWAGVSHARQKEETQSHSECARTPQTSGHWRLLSTRIANVQFHAFNSCPLSLGWCFPRASKRRNAESL